MKLKFNLKRELKIGAAILVVVIFIAFTERKQELVSIRDVSVKISNFEDNHFLDEADVMSLMQLNVNNIRGAKASDVNLKAIEKKIRKDPAARVTDILKKVFSN